MIYNMEELAAQAKSSRASDIHLVCGLPPKFRVDGRLENMAEVPLTEEDCINLCKWLAGELFDRL